MFKDLKWELVIMKEVLIKKSPKIDKKWRAWFINEGKHVDFGQRGYSDYTLHKDKERMHRYIQRHRRMHENWTRSGKYSAGFWSRWLLWSKPSMKAAAKETEKYLNYKIRFV